MFNEILSKVIDGKNLSQRQAFDAMNDIMAGRVSAVLLSSYLTALRVKGETIDEIAGSALAMREAALTFHTHQRNLVDTCGTGGDGKSGLNISTAAAFVVAGAGLAVAKHGNRALSSKSGSADVLQALGVRVDCPSACMEEALNRIGLCFLFAPHFHPAMKHAMPTRKELGFRTIFNVLGPLTNPAHARVQMIGVFSSGLVKPITQVLMKMGHAGGLIVHSNGWDEITLASPTEVGEVCQGKRRFYRLTNQDFGLPSVPASNLKTADAADNARRIMEILHGARVQARHVVVANAAATLWIAERSMGNKRMGLKEAVKRAQMSIESGQALKKVQELAQISHMLD